MTRQQSRLFRDKATRTGQARQQAARGTYDPAYLNYTIGKLMIRKLRDDWTATRGGARPGRRSTTSSCRTAGRRFRWSARR